MSDIQVRVLAAILPAQPKRMEVAQLRLVTEANFTHPHLRTLWQLVEGYYVDHMSVIPEWALKERMIRSGIPDDQAMVLLETYRKLSAIQIREDEFVESVNILKDEELARRTEEAVVSAREILRGEYIDPSSGDISDLRGQTDARTFLSGALQSLEVSDQEAAPEGDVRDDVETLWNEYLRLESAPEEESGIHYGIAEVDKCTGGIRPGELVLIAGFTGSGKSHVVTSIAWNALLSGKNVLMFTTETTRTEMEVRVLARHSRLPKFQIPGGLDSQEITSASLSVQGKESFRKVLTDFKDSGPGHLFMVQMPSNGNADFIQAKANQYNRKAPIDIILIDSINLVRSSQKYTSKREMLEDLLQSFKRFASSFDNGRGVAIVSPWQMSRPAWKEASDAGGVYTLASLADTSEAEKCQPLYSNVLTLDGYVPIGDIKVGDKVLNLNGDEVKVLEVHDNGNRPIYEVVTEDGFKVRCTPGHLWTICDSQGNKIDDVTTQYIMEHPENGYILPNPRNTVVYEFPTNNYLLHPFLVGLSLGNKSPENGYLSITIPAKWDVTNLFPVAPSTCFFRGTTMDDTMITYMWTEEELKAVPAYKHLKGANLFDGDYSKFQIPTLYAASDRVAATMVLMGLAGKPNPTVKIASKIDVFTLWEDLPMDHPSMASHLRYMMYGACRTSSTPPRRIVAVNDLHLVEPTRCITIDSEDSIYVTDGLVATHNSASQIITIFKVNEHDLNIQVLKNRGGREMPSTSIPYDYRNSYIGSGDSQGVAKNIKPQSNFDITSMLGM